jgi:UDPglucose--hexose-1-phosphate uridylyltransferase
MKGSELRQDPATKEWVVIAPERARRPQQNFQQPKPAGGAASCPFCKGNESMTPPEIFSINGKNGWQVRVVPNKFGALSPDRAPARSNAFFRSASGFGYHEVIIEHPDHFAQFVDFSEEHIAQVLRAYQRRQSELSKDDNIRFVVIFRNSGERAGTSLVHPHSQLLATPVVPAYMRWKHEVAERYFDDTNRNLYSDILEAERALATRIIEDDHDFTVFVPFASFVPYEMWIMPRIPTPSFTLASEHELQQLSGALRRSLLRLRECCGTVDYNFVIHSCSTRDEQEEYYLWHLQIIPRLTQPAGFELGSHMYINPMLPEECAQKLREATIDVPASSAIAG